MRAWRVIQFAIAAAFISIGCVILLSGAPPGFAVICFSLTTVVLLRRSELSRPVALRQLWIAIAILVALAGLIIVSNHFILRSAGDHFIREPVAIGTIWFVFMGVLLWRWKREKRLSDA